MKYEIWAFRKFGCSQNNIMEKRENDVISPFFHYIEFHCF